MDYEKTLPSCAAPPPLLSVTRRVGVAEDSFLVTTAETLMC